MKKLITLLLFTVCSGAMASECRKSPIGATVCADVVLNDETNSITLNNPTIEGLSFLNRKYFIDEAAAAFSMQSAEVTQVGIYKFMENNPQQMIMDKRKTNRHGETSYLAIGGLALAGETNYKSPSVVRQILTFDTDGLKRVVTSINCRH